MAYFTLIILVLCFFKGFYYGLYEIKQKQNKPGGIVVCLLAILRLNYTKCYHLFSLYHLSI